MNVRGGNILPVYKIGLSGNERKKKEGVIIKKDQKIIIFKDELHKRIEKISIDTAIIHKKAITQSKKLILR